MVLLAFSLQDQVEKYGAYVGIASFFGLAVLSLLYFAQAREVRRLRDWAGRSPERALELEERVIAQADTVRRVPQPQPAPVPVPAAAVATNGGHKLKPEQVAALAFARAAGVAEPPHPPTAAPAAVPQPAAVAVEASPTEVGAPVPPASEPATPPPANGNGHGHGDVPAPVTPAGRANPRPAAPLRQTPPPRRPAPAPGRRAASGPPPRRESSTGPLIAMLLAGVIAIGLVVFAGIQLLGGNSDNPPASTGSAKNPIVAPDETATPENGSDKPKPTPTPARDQVSVMILNGTTETGLAANQKDKLITAGYSNEKTQAGNGTPGATTSVVMYADGARAQARDVGRVLDISDVKPIDAATQAKGGGNQVVVIVGSDKSGN
jgi:LytR cell envelope-related transcriptional attenuator